MGPLNDVKVLDFSHLLPGELCSTALCEAGARVLRIESLQLTLGRMLPPIINGESLYFWSLHRNKERIGLNLKSELGVEIVHKLVRDYDVLVENFRPGVMERLGLGYDMLHAINKRLVYCSISGYGQSGKWCQRPGHDLNFVAESGIVEMNRRPGERPLLPPILVSDYSAALYAAMNVSAHLYQASKTGVGGHVDISMFESALSTMNIMGTTRLYEHANPELNGFEYPRELPNYTIYRCKDDRYLAVASLEPQFWTIFCRTIGRADLIQRNSATTDQILTEIIDKVIAEKTLAEWCTLFESTDCCVSPVNTILEAMQFAPAAERGVIQTMSHSTLGDIPQVTLPMSSRTESKAYDRRKLQTEEVLRGLNYDEDRIEKLRKEKVIQ